MNKKSKCVHVSPILKSNSSWPETTRIKPKPKADYLQKVFTPNPEITIKTYCNHDATDIPPVTTAEVTRLLKHNLSANKI